MSTAYAETHEAALRNAATAAGDVATARPDALKADVLWTALVNAHHTILNIEATITRLRELIEMQRRQLEECDRAAALIIAARRPGFGLVDTGRTTQA